VDLYSLLPAVVRYYDRYSSGIVGLDTTETTLQKVVYAMSQETAVSEALIVELQTLLDADNVRVQFLYLISKFLGVKFFGAWPEDKQRLFVKSLEKLYKASGQKKCWKAILNFIGYNGAQPYELWKEDIYEDFEYFRSSGQYYGGYHAARVDVDALSGSLLNDLLTEQELELLDNFRPIHVLIRKDGELVDKADTLVQIDQDDFSGGSSLLVEETLNSVSDTCIKACELHCEAGCEAGSCEGTFEISVNCVTNCELFCEVGCEDVCEITGIELLVGISTTDPSTGNPIALLIQYGSLFKFNGVRYNGDVVMMDPSTGLGMIFTIAAGEIYYEGGITNYTGTTETMITSTGAPITLVVVDGRINP